MAPKSTLSLLAAALLSTAASASPLAARNMTASAGGSGTVSITPHEQYSSSVGVLGCHIDTNRVAYWPGDVDCDNICVRLTHPASGRNLTVLKIDSSGGAHDVSYDAWNKLVFGQSASADPQEGGGVPVHWEYVDVDHCYPHLDAGKLPLSAPNSMNFVAGCLQSAPDSWVAKNHVLINIQDPVCHYGYDEVCTLDLAVSNQPSCPHTLGSKHQPTGQHVTNIQYGTGKSYTA